MSFWDQLVEELRTLGQNIAEWAILIGVAVVVLIVGRWILGWVRRGVERLLGAAWLDGIWTRSGIKGALGETDQTAASIAATIVYAYLMVGLLLVVARILNLATIENLLERLLLWVPQALLGAFIVIVAAAAADWTAQLVSPFANQRGISWLTTVVRVGVILLGVVFALDVINITFAEDVVKILLAATGVTLAIAFGVGGIDTAKKWWGKYATPAGVTEQTRRPDAP